MLPHSEEDELCARLFECHVEFCPSMRIFVKRNPLARPVSIDDGMAADVFVESRGGGENKDRIRKAR
jgi:hypothetical protein